MKKEPSRNQYDIVIVGGGIVGATLANLLVQLENRHGSGLKLALVDAGDWSTANLSAFDPRVLALSKRSEDLYRQLKLWDEVVALRACPYFDMHVWDADGTGNIQFGCADIHAENLGHIVENSVLLQVLQQKLAGERCLELFLARDLASCQIADGRALLELSSGECLQSLLVVAADGARSPLRSMTAIKTREWDYGHDAIVCTVRTQNPHQFTAWQRFSVDGPLAFLPLSADGQQQNACSIVWSLTRHLAEQVMALNDQQFCSRLGREFEYTLGEIVGVDERHRFPLQQRHARQYWAPHIALVGDAAHTIHPLAGQGANLGIYDVQVLAEEIERAVTRSLALSDTSILKRYDRRRQAHNLLAMGAMEGFKRLFGSRSLPLRWLRNTGLRRVNQAPWLKSQFSKFASGRL